MTIIRYRPPLDPNANFGPDGKSYSFGHLGEEHRIGRFIIVEARKDMEAPDDKDNLHFAVFEIHPETRVVRRSGHSWYSLNEALLAIVMFDEGVNINTISSTVPFVMGGIKSAAQED